MTMEQMTLPDLVRKILEAVVRDRDLALDMIEQIAFLTRKRGADRHDHLAKLAETIVKEMLHRPLNVVVRIGEAEIRPPTPAEINPDRRVISKKETAKLIGVSPESLTRWHQTGTGPKRLQLSTRRVGYRVSDIQAWLDKRAK